MYTAKDSTPMTHAPPTRRRFQQLLALARRIQADIQARFGVELEIEPNVL